MIDNILQGPGYNDYQVADSRLKERAEAYTQLNDNADDVQEARELPDTNRQAIQLASTADSLETTEKKARNQIERGYLDIRV